MKKREIKFKVINEKKRKWFGPFLLRSGKIDIPEGKIMLGTDLKDKNGKEIYEGDMITQQDYKDPLEVYFCEDCAGFRAKLPNFGNTELIQEDCEVIGNIYEDKT